MKKTSHILVQISRYSTKDEENITIRVPWKERFRTLFFGRLHIKVQRVPMLSITAKEIRCKKLSG